MAETGEGAGYADLHSHLVPGVDDGARTGEDTLEGVGRMWEAGIERVLTTPHLEGSLTHDSRALEARLGEVDDAWAWSSTAVRERYPELDFRRGFEIMLDVPDPDLEDERLKLGGTSFVLVEWPRMQVPPQSIQALSRIRSAGLRPILAHPERYFGLDPQLRVVEAWKEAGAYLQVNHGSLVGRYGNDARSIAGRLLRRGWVDYLATDFHGRSHLSLYFEEAEARLSTLGGEEQFDLLTGTNPSRVFRDREPLPVPPLEADPGLWGKLRGIFLGSSP